MHILTFDIEDWFHTFNKAHYGKVKEWETSTTHLLENTKRICDFLSEQHLKATFFWLGWEAERYPVLVKELATMGHEIAVHSFYHKKIDDLGRKAFKKDTERSIKTLEDMTGKKVKSYRAPGMSINNSTLWALDILYELGIENDSSVVTLNKQTKKAPFFPQEPFIFEHNGVEIKEFPVLTVSFLSFNFNYSGSGYFRVSPYWWLQKKILDTDYMLFYFHPRDFDVGIHNYIERNLYLKLRYRFGAKNALIKLEKILQNFEIINIDTANKQISWDRVQRIKI